jgi:hypothetical protein
MDTSGGSRTGLSSGNSNSMDSGIGGDMQFSMELGGSDGGSSHGLSSGNSNSMDSGWAWS